MSSFVNTSSEPIFSGCIVLRSSTARLTGTALDWPTHALDGSVTAPMNGTFAGTLDRPRSRPCESTTSPNSAACSKVAETFAVLSAASWPLTSVLSI
jgi:hypothetical protein